VTAVYVDTSALGRLLLQEPCAGAVLETLARFEERLASRLVAVELRRLALREDRGPRAHALLAALALMPVDEHVLAAAETIPPANVGTLDAIHLATAVALARGGLLDALLTYDLRLAAGARHHGLQVLMPA